MRGRRFPCGQSQASRISRAAKEDQFEEGRNFDCDGRHYLELHRGAHPPQDFALTYQAASDPLAQGFTQYTAGSSSTTGPLSNDLGIPAWTIAGTSQNSQLAYAKTLSTSQLADIGVGGFQLTMNARVSQAGLAPPYDATNHVTIGAIEISTGTKRWEIDLGIDSNGDTVAASATSLI